MPMLVHDEEKNTLRPVKLRERVVATMIARGLIEKKGVPGTVISRCREGCRIQFDDLSIAFTFAARLATADDELAQCEPMLEAA